MLAESICDDVVSTSFENKTKKQKWDEEMKLSTTVADDVDLSKSP
jgi:hypothetical protein